MLLQCCAKYRNIISRFKRVQVVGALPQCETRRPQLFESFAVPDTNTAPIVALQYDNRAIEHEGGNRNQISYSLDDCFTPAHLIDTISSAIAPWSCIFRKRVPDQFTTFLQEH